MQIREVIQAQKLAQKLEMAVMKWIIVGLILLGIGYNFILPFTPLWFDVLAWSAIATAFVIAAVRWRAEEKAKSKPSEMPKRQ